MTDRIDIERLLALAENATPGPWEIVPSDLPYGNWHSVIHDPSNESDEYYEVALNIHKRNAAYLKAVSPDVILALCDRLTEVKAIESRAVVAFADERLESIRLRKALAEAEAILNDLASLTNCRTYCPICGSRRYENHEPVCIIGRAVEWKGKP